MKIIFDHSKGHVIDDRVFCEAFVIPEDETFDDLIELGWLPNVQPPLYWYQSQSCRINNDKINLSYRRKKILSLLKYEIISYQENKNEVDIFFYTYFENKEIDMKRYYDLNSDFFDLKVMKVLYNNQVIAYTRFQDLERNNLGFETAYDSQHPKFSMGITSILLLSEFTKSQNKNYLYIYESYESHFQYKSEISGAELWEGEKWITKNIYN